MLFKLALRNVRRQASSYLIYFITVTLTVAFLFALNNMVFGEVLRRLHPAYESIVRPLLVALSAVLGAVIAFVLAYATAFLLRRRKKEFGLYLTMGMTRGNILALFAEETAVTFLCSLAAGVLLGLGLYQLLLYAFMQFIDGTYQAGGYAAGGILWTVLLVALIFLLASAASLGYLRFAKISALLAGEKKGEKKVRFPWLWPLLAAASLAAGTFACVRFVGWIGSSDFADRVGEATAYIALLLAALLLFPASLCQSGAWLLQRRDCCAANGLGRVTLRHISARLGGSSLLIGLLSILLAISLIGPNVFLASRALEERQVQVDQAFDVVAVHTEYTGVPYEEGVAVLEEYAAIEAQCYYTRYDCSEKTESGYARMSYVRESDFRALCALLGYALPDLGGPLRCEDAYYVYGIPAVGEFEYREGEGLSEGCVGTLVCPPNMISVGTYVESWVVVPDGQLQDYLSEWESVYTAACFAAQLGSERYDALAAQDALNALTDSLVSFRLREARRLEALVDFGLFFLAALFLFAVCLLLSAAMLALKSLTLVAEDKPRYRILWRLGAADAAMRRSLFVQLAVFFLAPLAVALLMNVPLLACFFALWQDLALFSFGQAVGTAAAVSAFLLAVLALYLAATCAIAWKDIRASIRSENRL